MQWNNRKRVLCVLCQNKELKEADSDTCDERML